MRPIPAEAPAVEAAEAVEAPPVGGPPAAVVEAAVEGVMVTTLLGAVVVLVAVGALAVAVEDAGKASRHQCPACNGGARRGDLIFYSSVL